MACWSLVIIVQVKPRHHFKPKWTCQLKPKEWIAVEFEIEMK